MTNIARTRIARAGVATAAAASTLLLIAVPAQAVDVNATGCTFIDYRVPSGSTVTFTLASGCILGMTDIRRGSPTVSPTTATGPATVTVTIYGPSDWTHLYFGGSGNPETFVSGCDGTDFIYEGSRYTLADYCPPAPPPPPDVLQQVAPGADGACTSVGADQLNIGGAGPGGWGRSWAQWVNGGTGGAVCTRTLTYDQSAGHWKVASPQGD